MVLFLIFALLLAFFLIMYRFRTDETINIIYFDTTMLSYGISIFYGFVGFCNSDIISLDNFSRSYTSVVEQLLRK